MDDKLLQIFAEESQEIIDSLERGLLELEGSEDPEEINAVFRAAHTMKGNAGIVGYEDVVDLTHLMEGILDEMRQGRLTPDGDVVGLLLGAVDALKLLIQGHLAGESPAPPREIMAMLARRLGQESAGTAPSPGAVLDAASPSSGQTTFHIVMRLMPEVLETGTDPLQILLELSDLGRLDRVECHDEALPEFPDLIGDRLYLWWEIWLTTKEPLAAVEDVFIFLRDENDIKIDVLSGDTSSGIADPSPQPPPTAPEKSLTPPTGTASVPTQAPPPTPASSKPPASSGRALAPVGHSASATIRVDTDKLDKLVN
ncbi:MAG: Hpt domain-containing protein, partial [Desulfarculus sp.]|nr:Hpt domain-containing protein [Desulfarculus sp.]